MLYRALRGLFDLVAPPGCAACGAPLAARLLGFCPACRPLIERLPRPWGEPSDRDACVYGGPLRDALHRLKYEGASELVPALAALLEEPAVDFVGRVDVVTSVPLHPRRVRERGYNQSALLGRALRAQLAVPFAARLLVRARSTAAQVGRRRQERAVQLAGAFVGSGRAAGLRVLVVDDVRTTGATFAEARRALHAAGAVAVYTLALARADRDHEADDLACL